MNIVPPIGTGKYLDDLQIAWENEHMHTFAGFSKWYNNKDVAPTMESMQKLIDFHNNKGIDTLKLGSNVPNLANFSSHESTDSKLYPFTETDKELFWKIRG